MSKMDSKITWHMKNQKDLYFIQGRRQAANLRWHRVSQMELLNNDFIFLKSYILAL